MVLASQAEDRPESKPCVNQRDSIIGAAQGRFGATSVDRDIGRSFIRILRDHGTCRFSVAQNSQALHYIEWRGMEQMIAEAFSGLDSVFN